jgi:hypothetical protein
MAEYPTLNTLVIKIVMQDEPCRRFLAWRGDRAQCRL